MCTSDGDRAAAREALDAPAKEPTSLAAARGKLMRRRRRIIYNNDGNDIFLKR